LSFWFTSGASQLWALLRNALALGFALKKHGVCLLASLKNAKRPPCHWVVVLLKGRSGFVGLAFVWLVF
jgi:hypothetical protein